jgi:hypothetical protein
MMTIFFSFSAVQDKTDNLFTLTEFVTTLRDDSATSPNVTDPALHSYFAKTTHARGTATRFDRPCKKAITAFV